ncbi:MAG: HAD family hydrolase [Erysipelotrichaceae bacterium]|nr:HAD family hydrolase [Erysipelotrichaceae bacterium]
MRKAVIFDIDGTLWDAKKTIRESWNEVLSERGYKLLTDEDIESILGKSLPEIGDIFFSYLGEEIKNFLTDECYRVQCINLKTRGGTLYPDEVTTLKKLHEDYLLMILTNAGKGYIESYLNTSHTEDLFIDYICYGDTLKNKTENLRILIERNNIDKAVYIGDTRDDQVYSANANVPFIFASYGFGKAIDPEYSISTFSEIPQVVKKIL